MSSVDPDVIVSAGTSGERAPVRLAVLDDHELLLDSLGSWISSNAPDFDLVLSAQKIGRAHV